VARGENSGCRAGKKKFMSRLEFRLQAEFDCLSPSRLKAELQAKNHAHIRKRGF
jgi:hypothetical protein